MKTKNVINLPAELLNMLDKDRISLVSKILEKKGTIVTVHGRRPLKLLSKFRNINIEAYKISCFQARIGINYEHLSFIKDRRGEGIKPQPLIGKKFIIHPYIIQSDKTGSLYVRLYGIKNNFQRKNEYYVNGIRLEEKNLKDYCLAEEYAHKGYDPVLVDYPLEGIVDIK